MPAEKGKGSHSPERRTNPSNLTVPGPGREESEWPWIGLLSSLE